jgi:SAM-dependent methyltransferase
MRANRDRTAALAFGQLVDHYDSGRFAHAPEFVGQTLARLGASAGGRTNLAGPTDLAGTATVASTAAAAGTVGPRLEVGAGTGQLTAALLADGAEVVAIEPSEPMADRLSQNLAGSVAAGQLSVRCQPFESLEAASFEPFSQIWSADAWHWIDPLIGYRLAAQLLRPDGLLICTWGYPMLTDHHLQRRLNQVYARLAPDLVRDPDCHIADLEPLLAEGRAEISGSGLMSVVDYWAQTTDAIMTAEQYADLQLSFANVTNMPQSQQAELSAAILGALAAARQPGTSLTTWRYTVASRPRQPAQA